MTWRRDYGIAGNWWVRFLLFLLRRATVPYERSVGRTFGVILVPWGEALPSERMFRAALNAATQEREQIDRVTT